MKRFLLFVAVAVALCGRSRSQDLDPRLDSIAHRGIDDVYNLEFERAEQEFSQIIALRPDHPAGHFFLAMVQWWRILIDFNNEQYDRRFYDSLDVVIDLCNSMLKKNEDDVTAIFFKGGAIGFQGRLRFHRSDYFAAANAGRKALPLVQEAFSLDPHNYDILLGTGIYNYYADVIPGEYPFVKPLLLFIPSGDKKKGLEQLTLAAEHGRYASVEASYFLMQIYYFYEHDYGKALALAKTLHERYPNNMLFYKYLGRCYVSLSQWALVREVFTDMIARVRTAQRGYSASEEREAEYYVGMCDMNDHLLQSAQQHFFRCDELSRTLDRGDQSGFMVMANLKAGMIYDLLSRRDLAVSQYNKVLSMKEYKDSYTLAEQYLKKPFTQ